jgi:hypothetical protein
MQSLCLVADPSSRTYFMRKFFPFEVWDEVRPFLLHLVADSIKTLSILGALYVFWEVVALLRFSGYPEDLLEKFEKAHFAFMYMAFWITGANFVFKQGASLWTKKQ